MRLARSFSPIAILRAASLLLLLGAAAPTRTLMVGFGLAQQLGRIRLSLLAAAYRGVMATPLVMGVGALGFAACAFTPQGARAPVAIA